MYCYCLSYIVHTYINLNKQPKGTVIVLVITIKPTIVLINSKRYCHCLSYTDYTYNNLNKQPNDTVIVLVISTIYLQ